MTTDAPGRHTAHASSAPASDDAWRTALSLHLEQLTATLERLRRMGLEDTRWTSPTLVDVAHQEMTVRTREVLRVALGVLEGTQLSCQARLEAPAVDSGMVKEASDLDGLVFAARADLQQFEHLLRKAYGEVDPFVALELCQRVVRHLRRALAAVGRALAHRVGVEVSLGATEEDAQELSHARRLRGAYARLRAVVSGPHDTPVDGLLASSAALTLLVEGPGFVAARLGDKRALWQLETRVADWRVRGCAWREAEELLGDFAVAVELLWRINQRESLARHDLATLELIERSLRAGDRHGVWALLDYVKGLDARLDACAAKRDAGPELSRVVSELAQRLRAARPGGAA